MRKPSLAFILFTALVLSACGSGGGVQVENIWARPALAGQNSAIYFEIENTSDQDEVLLAVRADTARAIEIHETRMMEMSKDDMPMESEGEMSDGEEMDMGEMQHEAMQMVQLMELPLAAGESLSFEPGGLHIMMIDLDADLNVGDSFKATLVFESGLEVEIQAEVREP